jgi:hypothetical protein
MSKNFLAEMEIYIIRFLAVKVKVIHVRRRWRLLVGNHQPAQVGVHLVLGSDPLQNDILVSMLCISFGRNLWTKTGMVEIRAF